MLTTVVQALGRRYPFYSGVARLANGRHARAWLPRGGEEVVSLHHRLPDARIVVDQGDFVGRSIYLFGDLDPKVTWFCRAVLRQGDNLLDIGSNHGLIAVVGSQIVGPSGVVHAFEPQSQLCERILQSAQLNGATNIFVHPTALGEADGELSLYVPPENGGAASFNREHEALGYRQVVPVARLDDFANALRLDTVRLMKIDVEGFEAQVLRGARELLSRGRVDSVIFELNEPGVELPEAPSVRLLQSCGFAVFALPRSLTRPRLIPISEIVKRERVNDLVAIRPEVDVPPALFK